MSLNEWQIWQTYSTFFVEPIPDLDVAAQDMVRSGLVECAIIHDGTFYWLSGSTVERGQASVKLSPDRMHGSVSVAPEVQNPYVMEALFEAFHLRFAEVRQFGEEESLPPPYIRAFLGECRLASPEREILVYPVVKLHATGVVLLEMRIVSPDRELSLEEFVENYVNLYKWRFTEVWGPPGLALLYCRGFTYYQRHRWPIHLRAALLYLDRRNSIYVHNHTRAETSGDFEFGLAPLWKGPDDPHNQETRESNQRRVTGEGYSFTDLAQAIISATGIAISGLRRGLHLLVRGQRAPSELGNYWVARPHIHITRQQGQMESAKENEEKFRAAYGSIMGRIVGQSADMGSRYLPADARHSEDYGAYIAAQGTLWVWSQSGRRQEEPWALPNDSHLVYENQPKGELLDYGYMLHRRVAATVGRLGSSGQVLRAQQDLVELKMAMNEASVFGEIRELLINGWHNMGVHQLQELIAESLSIRRAQEAAAEEQRAVAWGVILTIAFGILAVPMLATEVIERVWGLLGIWRPSDSNAAKLLFIGVALVLVMIVLSLSRRVLLRKQPRRSVR